MAQVDGDGSARQTVQRVHDARAGERRNSHLAKSFQTSSSFVATLVSSTNQNPRRFLATRPLDRERTCDRLTDEIC